MTYTITTHQSELIEDLLERFNFEKVQIAMTALDWRWANIVEHDEVKSGHLTVPTIERMKRSCRNILYRSIKDKSVGTGGFEARYYPAGEDDIEGETFGLKFIVAQTFTCRD